MKNLKLVALLCALSPATFANERLEEVVVISSRTEIPLRQIGTSVSVIDQEEIDLQGSSSLADLLRSQTSIGVSNAGGAGKVTTLRIRGEEGYRTLVLIDGVDISNPTSTQVSPQLEHIITGNSLSRIEILRGPQGFIYGADAGGVVNITTRSAEEGIAAHGSAEWGAFGTQNLSASLSSGSDDGDIFLSVDDMDTEGFNSRDFDTANEKDGYRNTTSHGKIGWNGDDLRAQLVLRHTDAESEYDVCYVVFTDPINDCLGKFEQFIGKLSVDLTKDTSSHYFGFSRSSVDREDFAAGQFSFGSKGGIEKSEYIGHYELNDDQKILFGGDVKREEIDAYGVDESRDQKAAFAEIQGASASRLFYTFGLRFDDSEDFGGHISGRLSLAYLQELGNVTLKYRSSIGNGFRAPSLYEVANSVAADTALKEEKSRGADLAIEAYFEGEAYAELVFFKQEVTDQIVYDDISRGYLQEEGTTTSQGVELSVEYPLLDNLKLTTTLTYNDTETEDGAQRILRPKYIGNVGFQSKLLQDKLSLMLNVRVVKDSTDDTDSGTVVALEDYETTDLSANYRFNKDVSFFARVENLGKNNYQELVGYNTAPRAASAGVRVTF